MSIYIGGNNITGGFTAEEKKQFNDSINSINEQLDNKANKNDVFSMSNMGQDVKEAMTGGSVAVVGKNAVLEENIVDNQVTINKTNFLEETTIVNEKLIGVSFSDDYIINSGVSNAVVFKTIINAKQRIKIKATNNDRFRIGVTNSINSNYNNLRLDRLVNKDGYNTYLFENDEFGKELYVYAKTTSTGTNTSLVNVIFEDYEIKAKDERFIVANKIDHKLISEEIDKNAIDYTNLAIYKDNLLQGTALGMGLYNEQDGLKIVKNKNEADNLLTYEFKINPKSYVRINTDGTNTKFRIGLMNEVITEYVEGSFVDRVLISDDTLKSFEFYNDKAKTLLIYLNAQINVKPKVELIEYVPKNLTANNLDHLITADEIEFFDCETRVHEKLIMSLNNSDTGDLIITNSKLGFLTYKINLKPYEKVCIKTSGNNKFRLGIVNTNEVRHGVKVDRIIVNDDSITEYEFFNDSEGKILLLYIYGVTGSNIEPECVFTVYTSKIFRDNTIKLNKEYGLKVTAVENGNISSTGIDTPVLCGTKVVNSGNTEPPRTIGWLYYMLEDNIYKLYYSSGVPDKLKYICDWEKSITYQGTSTPENYSPIITKDGDIIWVFRGEQIDGNRTEPPLNPLARQNPIIYPANDFNNPKVIDIGDIKPTSWLQNCGIDYIYSEDCFVFAEYTRTVHEKAYVWKVTKPFTNPSNWKITKEFVLSGSYIDGFKHCHTINYDNFSETLYLTTGDDSTAASIYQSKDFGETWTLALGNNEKYCRLLNFIFMKDCCYWASDSFKKGMHSLFKIQRDINGNLDFTQSNIQELWVFPVGRATYATCLIKDKGLLFLDRYDNKSAEPLDIYFWSFETNSMHKVITINSLDGTATNTGFRNEAVNFYPSLIDDRIVCGFGYFKNCNDLLGNTESNQIKNLVLELEETIVTSQ